jgi:uncharacterized membrane protein
MRKILKNPKPLEPKKNIEISEEDAKIAKLQELLAKGVLTKEEYSISVAKLTSVQKAPLVEEEPKVVAQTTELSDEEAKLAKLKELLAKGVLTKEEYEHSVAKIKGTETNSSKKPEEKVVTQKTEISEEDAKLAKLKELLARGVLNQKEYDHSVSKLKETATPVTISTSNLSPEDQAKVDKLNGLLQRGVLNQKEYDHSISKLGISK